MTREEAILTAIKFCKENKIHITKTVHATAYVGTQYETDYLYVKGLRWKVFFTGEEETNIPDSYLSKKNIKKINYAKKGRQEAFLEGPYNQSTTIIVHPNGQCTRKI